MTPFSPFALSFVLTLSAAGAAAPSAREAAVRPLVAALKAEVEKLSPYLLAAVDWNRLDATLVDAGQDPAPWLARNALLVQVYNRADWPMDQRLALLRAFYQDRNVAVRRLVVDLLSREDAVKAGSLADLRKVVETETDPAVKVDAAQKLLERNDPAGWTPLLSLLSSDDPAVRSDQAVKASPNREAKEALVYLSTVCWKFESNAARLPEPLRLTPEHLALITKAFEMTDNVVRRTAVELIGLNRDPKTFPILKERAEKDVAWTTLRSTYISLGYLGDPAAIPILKAALAKPKVARVGRTTPCLGLAFLGDPAGLQVLVGALEKGTEFPVLCKALSRAFDPEFDEAQGLFLVPDAAGRMVPSWIPSASAGAAPMLDDGQGGHARAHAMTPAEVHAAWKAFLDTFGPRLAWDKTACRFFPPAK